MLYMVRSVCAPSVGSTTLSCRVVFSGSANLDDAVCNDGLCMTLFAHFAYVLITGVSTHKLTLLI